jgi:hypothetical protein
MGAGPANSKRDTFVESQVSKNARPGAPSDFSVSAFKGNSRMLSPKTWPARCESQKPSVQLVWFPPLRKGRARMGHPRH